MIFTAHVFNISLNRYTTAVSLVNRTGAVGSKYLPGAVPYSIDNTSNIIMNDYVPGKSKFSQ